MNIEKGNRTGGGAFSKQVGMAEFKLGCFNPTKEELSEYLGTDIDRDLEYVGENREGKTSVMLKFWLESGEHKIPVQFNIIDELATNKDGDKFQWINQVGMASYAPDKDSLPGWFKNFQDKEKNDMGPKTFRKAYRGEADFYNFLRNLLNNGSNFFAVGTDILMDEKKLFRGNFKEVLDAINSEFVGTIMAGAVVNSYVKDGETKYANRIYNKEFLPGYCYQGWKTRGKSAGRNVQRFVEQFVYCKDSWANTVLADFLPGEVEEQAHVPSGSTSLEDSDY